MSPPPPPKRRRLRACNSCRGRKIRCDSLPGSCRNCETYGIPCETSREGVAPARSPTASATLTQPVIKRQTSGRPTQASGSTTYSPHRDGCGPDAAQLTSPQRPDILQGVVTTEVSVSPKNSKFAGMSSAHVLAKAAEDLYKFQAPQVSVMDFLCPAMSFSEEFNTPFSHIPPLIAKDTADGYVQRYKSSYALLLPILEPTDFDNDYKAFYDNSQIEPSRAACVILAIALGSDDESIRDSHFRAVYDISFQFTARPYLASVQAFLLMVRHLQTARDSADIHETLYWIDLGKDGQAFLTLGTAVRIAQSIGLHRGLSTHRHPHEFNFVLREHNLRSSLWWVCYCLDKKLSFEGGRPSAICDENCDADMPQRVPITSPTGLVSVDTSPFIFIHHLAGICQLLSTISSSLFNINTSSLNEADLVDRIDTADTALITWAKSLPPELDPDRELAGVHDEISRVAGTILHCVYFNALLVIHRASLISDDRPSPHTRNHSNPRIATSAHTCLQAARSLARSANNLVTERRQIPVPRWISQYPVNALMALFVETMRSPAKWSCAMDLALMNSLQYCFCRSEDKAAAARFGVLMAALSSAVKDAADVVGNEQNGSYAVPHKINPSDSHTSAKSAPQSAEAPFLPHVPALAAESDYGMNVPDRDDNFGFGDLFGDYPNLWNMQMWPVAHMDEHLQNGPS